MRYSPASRSMEREQLMTLSLVFLLRFGLGQISYAARTARRIVYAPMMVLGKAQSGLIFGNSLFATGCPP